MKRVFILLVSLFAMMASSLSAKAQEITITLYPGNNWISYPNADVMDIASALGDFVPMNGDVIKSQNTSSSYNNGNWRGGITHFMPGWGYMYYSARSETVEFSFAHPSSTSVATATPTVITATSAVVGGTVTVPEGSHVFLRGVCWGTEPSPDIDGDHTTEETGIGSFSSTLEGLNPNTTYYVRAYAVSDYGLAYGGEQSFTTEAGGGSGGDHAYVDLGLPSGTLWATYNVGADAPDEYGDYFAWGETQPKSSYNWSTYQYCNGSSYTLTKYCSKSSDGYNGFTDNLITLLPEDDAATSNWGSEWRMPTKEEWEELYNNTTVTWTTQNGVNGRLFIASNGIRLFLPAAGYRSNSSLNQAGSAGLYLSSTLNTDGPSSARYFSFYSDDYSMTSGYRSIGRSVRAVRSGQSVHYTVSVSVSPNDGGIVSGSGIYGRGQNCTVTATANSGYVFTNWTENGEVVSTYAVYTFTVTGNRNLVANFTASSGEDRAYIDLGLPSGTLWATCNVGADAPEEYGDYFAWGETQPKSTYNWGTYQYCNGEGNFLTKYCNDASYGYNGFTDNLTTLLIEDDAARANWGSAWRMPTMEEWQELYSNTTVTWTTQNGVNGRLFTAENGNSLFLPSAGCRIESSLRDAGSYGYYWSSTLRTVYPSHAGLFYFNSYNYDMGYRDRLCGQSVRPVRSSVQN